jgi:Ca2+-binding RTX toxin-like protein
MTHARRGSIIVGSTVAIAAALLILPQTAFAARPRCFGDRPTIVGTATADVLKGTSRVDVIVGLGGDDVIKGLRGSDRICGGKGGDTVIGGAAEDMLEGDEGRDTLSGGSRSDFLVGGSGGDTLKGGRGVGDMASFVVAPRAVAVDLTAGTARGDGVDALTGVEDIDGSRFDDVIKGSAASNFLYGENGDDTLSGSAGDRDGLWGGGGNDHLDGGPGEDFASFFLSPAGVTANLTTGTATGEGADTLTNIEDLAGSKHDDTFTGTAESNVFWSSLGNDTLDGGTGTDTISYEFSETAVTANLVAGTATGEGSDTLTAMEDVIGGPFADDLSGDAGPNALDGAAGDDTLTGGDGDDFLTGGDGTDALDGGIGTDACDGETELNCEA